MPEEKRKRKDRWLLLTVLALFFIGVGIRSYDYVSASNTQPTPTSRTRSLSPAGLRESGQNAQTRTLSVKEPAESDLLLSLAPYLTEGGLSFFLGFCIGYFLRLVTRTAMFLVGGLYCCLILLSHYGVITVDWGIFQQILQQILLNTQEHVQDLKEVLTIGIPSVTMGGVGIWRGLKKP